MPMVRGATGLRHRTIRTSQTLAQAGIREERIAGAIRRAGAPGGTTGEAAAIGHHILTVRHLGTLRAEATPVAAGATAEPTLTIRGRETARPEAMAGLLADEEEGWTRQ